jgi:hypothetical protein
MKTLNILHLVHSEKQEILYVRTNHTDLQSQLKTITAALHHRLLTTSKFLQYLLILSTGTYY